MTRQLIIGLFCVFSVASSSAQLLEKGRATYYANKFVGRKTANGEVYTHQDLTAAHRTIPLGSRVRVTRLDNEKSVVVKVNDRCANHAGGIIDLSRGAAECLDFVRAGVANVKLELVDEGLSPDEMASAKYQIKTGQAPEMDALMPQISMLSEHGFENLTVQYFSQTEQPYYELLIGPYKHKANALLVAQTLQKEGLNAAVVEKKD